MQLGIYELSLHFHMKGKAFQMLSHVEDVAGTFDFTQIRSQKLGRHAMNAWCRSVSRSLIEGPKGGSYTISLLLLLVTESLNLVKETQLMIINLKATVMYSWLLPWSMKTRSLTVRMLQASCIGRGGVT